MLPFIKKISSTFDPSRTEKEIEVLEQKYDIAFPKAYRGYAVQYDGAEIRLQKFEVNGYLCEVSGIVPIYGPGLTFEKIVNNDRQDGFVDVHLFPLALNRGGDIYYWDSKTYHVFLLLTDDIDNPYRVSDSVDDFFKLLM